MKQILDPFILESLNEELKYISAFFNKAMNTFVEFYIFVDNKIFEIDKVNIKEIEKWDIYKNESVDLNLLKEKIVDFFKVKKENIFINSYLNNSYLIVICKSNDKDKNINCNEINNLNFINKIISSILVKYIYEDKVNKLNYEIKSLKESLYLREMEISTIYKLEKLFLEETDMEDSIKKILEIAINTLNSDNGSISLLKGEELIFYIISSKSPEVLTNKKIKKDTGIIGKAIKERKTIIVNDVERSTLWAKSIAKEIDYIPKAIIASPIIAPNKKVIGGIEIMHRKENIKFSKSDEILLTIFANHIGRFLFYKKLTNQDREKK